MSRGVVSATAIQGFIEDENDKRPPLKFSGVTAELILKYIIHLRNKAESEGTFLGFGTYSQDRAAINHLLRAYKAPLSAEQSAELALHFRGLKRQIAKSMSGGEGKVQTGKDPLPFGLYKRIAMGYMKSQQNDFVFNHTFMLFCWNLMCRSANAVSICYSHLEWKGDALGVYFCHMKNDQAGERPRDARHVYANHINPEICPILSLGIYLMCYGVGDTLLFPGGKQYDRYRQSMSKFLGSEELHPILNDYGLQASDLGTHSARKGAASYCSSGSTVGPSNTAVHLRAGWSMGAVQNTYLR